MTLYAASHFFHSGLDTEISSEEDYGQPITQLFDRVMHHSGLYGTKHIPISLSIFPANLHDIFPEIL